MDSRHSRQDIIRCDLCKVSSVQNYCDFCQVNLCKQCVGEHISDGYNKHAIVLFKERNSTLMFPTCKIHSKETCKLQCKSCKISICALCSASEKHKGHDFIVLEDIYKTKKAIIEKDTEELQKVIAPTYADIRNELIGQIESIDRAYEKITTVISKQGEKWHTEVDLVIIKLEREITEMKKKHRSILEKSLSEIKQIESLIKKSIFTLNKLEESNDVSVVVEFKTKNKELSKLPPKVHVTLPTFCPMPIHRRRIYEIFGSLTPSMTTIDDNGFIMKLQERSSRELLGIPEVINTFKTGNKCLRSISFHSGGVWTSARIGDIKCFDTEGKCINTITTKSREMPNDLAITSDGYLVYCDWKLATLNKVKDEKIEEIKAFQEWVPINMCVAFNGDFLVSIYKKSMDNRTQSKVIRYSGRTEKQIIQFDDKGKPIYSENNATKYITENRNHDICVADCEAGAVVVVNLEGKLRWKYTGHFSAGMKCAFKPNGITTNSKSLILTANNNNDRIHILDQNGQFLRYIDEVKKPYGLCVDNLDNLFVTDYFTGNVKVIKYLK